MRIDPTQIWDLSQPVSHDGPCWPEQTPPSIRHNEHAALTGFNVETIEMTDHTGTHVDAPYHHYDDAATIDRMPLEAFAGPALFVDLRDRVEAETEIGPEHLDGRIDDLREGDFAILVTGWGERRGITEEFLKRFPFLGGEGARLLLERGIAGVGIDALSIGGFGGPAVGVPAHAALLSAAVPIVEELHVPAELAGRRAYFSAFPILLEGCGGAPARAVAWGLAED